jgi:hypothetical protein
MRVFFAVVTGYLIFGISAALLFQFSGQDPHAVPSLGFAILSVLWGIVFALIGGYVAVVCARRDSMLAGVWVSGLLAVLAAVSLFAQWGAGSIWSQLAALLLMAPAASLGGWIAMTMRRRKLRSGTSGAVPGRASLP